MNSRLLTTIAGLVGLAVYLSAEQAISQTRELGDSGILLDRIVAVVNDGVVLKSELDRQTEMIARRLSAQRTQLPPRQILEQQVLERLIIVQVQLQRAKSAGIVISDEDLNTALSRIAQRNSVTLSELPQMLAAEGIEYPVYREEMRREMTIEQLKQRDVMRRINVSPKEIDRFLKDQVKTDATNTEYNLSHILIGVPTGATPEQAKQASDRAQNIFLRLQSGDDFCELAVSYSDGQQALECGALGWRKGSQLPTFLSQAAMSLDVDEVSEPIRNPSGYHILRMNEMRGGGEQSVIKQHQTRHILIRTNEMIDDGIAEQQLKDIRQSILDGEDFATIAKAVSEDPTSAKDGGDLGFQTPGTFVEAYEDVVVDMKPGDLSQPFKSPFGWHLVEFIAERDFDNTDEIKRQQAYRSLLLGKAEEEEAIWVRRLRDQAFVEYRL